MTWRSRRNYLSTNLWSHQHNSTVEKRGRCADRSWSICGPISPKLSPSYNLNQMTGQDTRHWGSSSYLFHTEWRKPSFLHRLRWTGRVVQYGPHSSSGACLLDGQQYDAKRPGYGNRNVVFKILSRTISRKQNFTWTLGNHAHLISLHSVFLCIKESRNWMNITWRFEN